MEELAVHQPVAAVVAAVVRGKLVQMVAQVKAEMDISHR
jgi:hypothetical protein